VFPSSLELRRIAKVHNRSNSEHLTAAYSENRVKRANPAQGESGSFRKKVEVTFVV
jgi:hypothetical protein